MKKNVKGFIGLFAGLGALLFVILSICVLAEPIKGSSKTFYGSMNVGFAVVAIFLSIAAIVFGILSIKGGKEKKGPRKSGIIVGAVMLFIAFIATIVIGMLALVSDYANNGEKSFLYESILKDKPDSQKKLDELDERVNDLFYK